MKRLSRIVLSLALCVSICASSTPVQAASVGELESKAAVVINADTGEVLYSKNMNTRQYPASITKILTGLLVVEQCAMDEVLTASSTAIQLPPGYANIALKSGERMVVGDAMYALMLASANDVANALGEHVGGSQSGFAAMMNRRAREAGALNSSFVNASGVPSNSHYTTAYDMAMITRAAYQNDSFMRYMSARDYTLPSTNVRTTALEISNHHLMMLEDEDYYYPDVVGGKIGYTNQAQHTMCTVASRGGHTYIVVVMNSTQRGKYTDTAALLDWAFATHNTIYVQNLFDFLD